MAILIFAIYLLSLGIQFHSLVLVRKTIIQYQKEWLSNLIFIIGFTIILINHFYSFFKNLNVTGVGIIEGLLILSNSLIFYAIILCIRLITRLIGNKTKKLILKLRYDPLTKVLSREEILTHCERELARAIRSGETVSLLTIDMDNFKVINDTYGHPIGDEVLIRSANYCKELLREIDLIGRIGGDEFIVLLPNTDNESAQDIANRILSKMRNLVNELSIRTDKPISLSIGIAGFDPLHLKKSQKIFNPKRYLKKLIHSSDRALYEAKKCGRNRYAIASNYANNFKMG